MFTGIIERTGKVVSLTLADCRAEGGQAASITQLIVDPGRGFETVIGDSVAVNGCCLTVTANKVALLAFDVGHETIKRTSLSSLKEGDEVNLERAATLGTRLGGHLVSGHIDGIAVVTRVDHRADGWTIQLKVPRSLGRYLIAKGSVALDGISLTVASINDVASDTFFEIMLIPTTVSITTMKALEVGKQINFEADMIGKYVERLHVVFPKV